MRIFSFSTLRSFWTRPGCQNAEGPLRAWHKAVEGAQWETPADVRKFANSADFVANDRVIFDIGGNKYRLIAHVRYAPFYTVFVCFVGTHAEYDAVDAATVRTR